MITAEVDGIKIKVIQGTTIMAAADQLNIPIPRLCYHKKLSIIASCRICLVEIVGSDVLVPACSTKIINNMKICTNSDRVINARKDIIELLLVNHPLDCFTCDKAGTCELQDITVQYAEDDILPQEEKTITANMDINNIISINVNRCIYCMRCTRFLEEIAKVYEFGVKSKSYSKNFLPFLVESSCSKVFGNIIDLCPVGALIMKNTGINTKLWEIKKIPSISPYDCVGTNIYINVYNDQIVQITPRENSEINDIWITDRDRFRYKDLYSAQRIKQPMIKYDNKWLPISWENALELTNDKLREIIDEYGADEIGGLVSTSSSLEEQYIFQKYLRQLGSHNIDHRIQQIDFNVKCNMPLLPDIKMYDYILLVNSDIHQEQPIIGLKILQILAKGGIVHSITEDEFINSSFNQQKILSAKNKLILLGTKVLNSVNLCKIVQLCGNNKFAFLTEGANTMGAWITNCIPDKQMGGKNIQEMLDKPLQAYLLLGLEPIDKLKKLKNSNFIIIFSAYYEDLFMDIGSILLPISPFVEMSGTFVNVAGKWQQFYQAIPALGESKAAWEIINNLGKLANLEGFNYKNADIILHEVKKRVPL